MDIIINTAYAYILEILGIDLLHNNKVYLSLIEHFLANLCAL